MLKRILAVFLCFFSVSVFACSNALPTDDVNFCASFKGAATCYCTASGVPAGMCQDMNALYNRLMVVFGSLQDACKFQRYTSAQDCIDNWTCYRNGGIDSRGRACSSTQRPCQ